MSIAKSERERPLLHAPVSAALYCGTCASLLFSVIACLPSLPCLPVQRCSGHEQMKPRLIFSPYPLPCGVPPRDNSRAEHTVGMQDKRLLICDDEPAFGRFVQNVAEDLGYEVRVTTDGRAFIEAYNSFKPTMIILDMIMPGMDGNEIVLWLAQPKCTAHLIIITGYTPAYAAHDKVLAEYKGLRPVTTLYKPIEVSELRAVLGSQESS